MEGLPPEDPPHVVSSSRNSDDEYIVAIPTYGRWRPALEVSKKSELKDCHMPFVLTHTLHLLLTQGIPISRVILFVADETEAHCYRRALRWTAWADVRIEVSVKGVRDSRNFICKFFPAGTHVVSLDDDLVEIRWKFCSGDGHDTVKTLPPGGLPSIIRHARWKMAESGACLWGLNTSQNPKWMNTTTISARNGLVNGYIHGFISRPDCPELLRTLVDAVEDAEFSVRHFAKDGAVLRYRMYTGITSPFANSGGLQAKYEGDVGCRVTNQSRCAARKVEERWGAAELSRLFPYAVGAPRQRDKASRTMEVTFLQRRHPKTNRQPQLRMKRRHCDIIGGTSGGTPDSANKRRQVFNRSAVESQRAICTRGVVTARLKMVAASTPRKFVKTLSLRNRRLRVGKLVPARSTIKQKKASNLQQQPKTSAKGASIDLDDEDLILYASNPKRPGSAAHALYESYQGARTVAEAKLLGARAIDFAFDCWHGHLVITKLSTCPRCDVRKVNEGDVDFNSEEAATALTLGTDKDLPVKIRIKGNYVKLPRQAVMALAQRSPALRSASEDSWHSDDGPFAASSLATVRTLMRWAEEGVLSVPKGYATEVSAALVACGVQRLAESVDGVADDETRGLERGQTDLLSFFGGRRSETLPTPSRVLGEPTPPLSSSFLGGSVASPMKHATTPPTGNQGILAFFAPRAKVAP
jgi:hypothetical protein